MNTLPPSARRVYLLHRPIAIGSIAIDLILLQIYASYTDLAKDQALSWGAAMLGVSIPLALLYLFMDFLHQSGGIQPSYSPFPIKLLWVQGTEFTTLVSLLVVFNHLSSLAAWTFTIFGIPALAICMYITIKAP